MKCISRRAALGTGLAAPLTLLGAQPAIAANSGISALIAVAHFKAPELDQVLIGLLLPAVQAAREPAKLLLVNTLGQTTEILLPAVQQGLGTAYYRISGGGIAAAGGVTSLLVSEVGTNRTWQVPTQDGILMALLLPAVQRGGSAFLAGSAQILSDGRTQALVPFIEQQSLRSGGHQFVGPFPLDQEGYTEMSLLLPAVQKVRQPARLLILNGLGAAIAQVELPTEGATAPVPVLMRLFWEGNVVKVQQLFGDGSVKEVGAGTSPNGMLIGLLLPAVQRNGRPAGLLGGAVHVGPDIYDLSWGANQGSRAPL